jgi:hypothetical protein
MKTDDTYRKTATLVGVLYIIGTVAGILSVVLTGPILAGPDYFMKISANQTRFIIGALCILVMGLALVMIPMLMYPILKRWNEPLALGYIVFRGALETGFYIAMTVALLILVPLSQAYGKAGAPDASSFQALGTLVLAGRDILDPLNAVIFPLGALMFYYLLYQSNLIPRWISGWGLIGIVPFLAASLLVLFGYLDPMSSVRNLLYLPLALQEMVMAVWLIVKGFNPSAIASGSATGE